jgi:hypothetical protein
MRGWDEDGKPTSGKLYWLDLDWLVSILYASHA